MGNLPPPCSSSALMNRHTSKLNNRRCIEWHTKTGNQEKVSCFFASIFGILENRRYYAVQRGNKKTSINLRQFCFAWCCMNQAEERGKKSHYCPCQKTSRNHLHYAEAGYPPSMNPVLRQDVKAANKNSFPGTYEN